MNPPASLALEGILLVDKPTHCTSHDVVNRLRRKLQLKQIGHAGTLDPMATGLLVMLIGKATKVSQYLTSLDKEYEGTIRLGTTTDTYDLEGEVVESRPVPELTIEDLQREANAFVGDQYQTPPMFSAKKLNGVPLYKLARKGKEVEREPRFIHVSRFNISNWATPEAAFALACSKGTYVRSLAHDLGKKMGCGATLSSLRRTATDRFRIDQSATLEAIEAMSLSELRRLLIPVYQAVPSHVL